MNKHLFCLAILAIGFGSCQTKEQDLIGDGIPAPEIIASVETRSGTKSLIEVDELGEGTIYWTPADQINIFYGTTSTLYTSQNTVNATTAVFRTTDIIGSTESASTNIWGLYPYDEDAICNGTKVTTTLPATQYGVSETFDDDLYITLAHSTTNALKFFNVCGGIKFSLSREDITSVSFKGNNNEDIAGDISLTFENDLPKATVVSGLKEITLTPKTGSTFEKDVNYYLIVLPGTLSGGFTMTFTTANGSVGTFNYTTKAITIKRSVFSKKAEIDTYATFTEVQPNNVIYYTSIDETIITPYATDVFGATIQSNEYVDGRGVLTFNKDITTIGVNAFRNCTRLETIDIPQTVTTIGGSSFLYCESLTTVRVPQALKSIGDMAFYNCGALSTIDLSRTNLTSIGRSSFMGCRSITTIFIPNSVTSIGLYVFAGCESLSLFIGKYATDNGRCLVVDNNLIAFAPNGLTNYTIPSGITTITSAFCRCENLSSVIIPTSVTVIQNGAFSTCTSLTSITIPTSVTSLGIDAFFASGLNSITIPSNVETIGTTAFDSCRNLESVIIENGVKVIGDGAFNYCTKLTSITIPESVTTIYARAFSNCTSLSSIIVRSEVPPTFAYGSQTAFDYTTCPIFVPSNSVNAYKTAWNGYADRIKTIFQTIPISTPTPLAIDLGLSVKWASFNLGASQPQGNGGYYAWGETEPKNAYGPSTYLWCVASYDKLTKYCTSSNWGYKGFTDGKSELSPEDDAAHVHLGGGWRIPTKAEMTELINQCDWEWTTQNGVKNGWRVTGSNGNSIFLPAAGSWDELQLCDDGLIGHYWSSTIDSSLQPYAYALWLYSNEISLNSGGSPRAYGFSIRPVYAE